MVSRRSRHPGGGTIGVLVLGFEVAQPEERDHVEKRLAQRHANVRRLRRDSYETVVGADPDNYAIAISAGSTGRLTQMVESSVPGEIIEAIAQVMVFRRSNQQPLAPQASVPELQSRKRCTRS
jgi:hypothetical protein